MRRYSKDDYGFYSMNFFDELGARTLPDWDSSLYWEFYDSTAVLRFTATTISDPPLEQDTDVEGSFVKVANIPLADFELGDCQVKVYAKKAGAEIEPYPYIANAFTVYQSDFVGAYATPEEVEELTGVEPDDLDKETVTSLRELLYRWLLQAKNYIDEYTSQSWEVDPLGCPEMITNCSIRIVSNMVSLARQLRKTPIIRVDDFDLKLIDGIVVSDNIKTDLNRFVEKSVETADGTNPKIAFATLITPEQIALSEIEWEDMW